MRSLLPPPLTTRRGIPFYYDKTEAEFRADAYEQFATLVARQTALHLCDSLHGGYPFQPTLDFLLAHLPPTARTVADLGCSVGRLGAEIALREPGRVVYGIDLSYQMLRRAAEVWQRGGAPPPDLIRYGWGTPDLPARELDNLHFALARAEQLPFPDESLDAIVHSFLLDRLPDPAAALDEWARCLRPGGYLIGVSPLNFLTAAGWQQYHPPVRLLDRFRVRGWQLCEWVDPFPLYEPLDARGNGVQWKAVAFVFAKAGPG